MTSQHCQDDKTHKDLENLERIGAEVLIKETKKYLQACWANREALVQSDSEEFVEIKEIAEKIRSYCNLEAEK